MTVAILRKIVIICFFIPYCLQSCYEFHNLICCYQAVCRSIYQLIQSFGNLKYEIQLIRIHGKAVVICSWTFIESAIIKTVSLSKQGDGHKKLAKTFYYLFLVVFKSVVVIVMIMMMTICFMCMSTVFLISLLHMYANC